MPGRCPGRGDGRAGDADLPDHLLRLRRRRPCRLAVRAAGLRQHLLPHRQPDLRRARRARRGARRRHGGARGRLRPCGAVPGLPRSAPARRRVRRGASKLYGGSINQFNHSYKNFGWNVAWADSGRSGDASRPPSRRRPRRSSSNSIANPGGVIVDLQAIAAIAKKHNIPLIVDNTMASPYLIRPFEHGADIIVHSATKFLGGHGNSIGGVIVDGGSFNFARRRPLSRCCRSRGRNTAAWCSARPSAISASPSPAACSACATSGRRCRPSTPSCILTGIETLPLRMQRHSDNALAVAEHLAEPRARCPG